MWPQIKPRGRRDRARRVALDLHGLRLPRPGDNELHREWGTTAAKYRARYLISGLKFADGTSGWKSAARALSHRLEDGAALATLTTNLRHDS